MRKKLGKIKSLKFGLVGYQEACLGLAIEFSLEGGGTGVGFDKSTWDPNMIECGERCKWTEEDRSKGFDEIMRYISDLLSKAKVREINSLVGTPVEVEFDGNVLKDWRILEEVL